MIYNVDTFQNLFLKDYCNYVICCLSAIYDSKDEPKEFNTNKRFRSRTYQLYIMLEYLFGHLIPEMTQGEKILYKQVPSKIDNSVDIFFDDNKLYQLAEEIDFKIMLDLIRKRVGIIINTVQNSKDNILISSRSFHVDDHLHLRIGIEHYNNAVKKITETYLSFV